MYPFGIDISKYQGVVDFDVMFTNHPEIRFIAARAGISWGYVDSFFFRNWQEIKRKSCPRAAYHVLYPGENVTRQVDHLFNDLLKDDLGEFGPVLDLELDHGLGKRQITDAVHAYGFLVKERIGKLPILYSRYSWLKEHTYYTELLEWDLWMAQYLFREPGETYAEEYPMPTAYPPGGKLIFGQTGDKTPATGFGIPPSNPIYLDYDRFNGTESEFQEWLGVAPGGLSVEQKVDLLWDAHPELHPA